jgi:hypothetical protein
MSRLYDRIGGQYARGRLADPRIAARIRSALDGARSVVNVGAGGGSYEPYLDPMVWRSMSALALIPEGDRLAGMRRLEADLNSGEWDRRWGSLLALDELDLGYRLLTARP